MKTSGNLLITVVLAITGAAFWGMSSVERVEAAELTQVNIRLDFLYGGKHAPWFVAMEKGFYAKHGLKVNIEAGKGSADTVRAVATGGADFGFADISTAIVARSRGLPIRVVGQLGYVGATILWREGSPIKRVKDLEGKTWAISPGQAQWYLMPGYSRINGINFKSIKIQETAPPLQPAALLTRKADFIIQFRGSNDEVAEVAAKRIGVNLERVFMKDTGLDAYGSGLIARNDDVRRRPALVRAYVQATMEGLRYTRDHQEESLQIILKHRPELDEALTIWQLKNALYDIMLPLESVKNGLGFMERPRMNKTVQITNEYFDVARKVSAEEIFSNDFINR